MNATIASQIRDALLTATRTRQAVSLPGLTGAFVQELTSDDVIDFTVLQRAGDGGAAVAFLVIRGTVDGDGAPIFTDSDTAAVRKLPATIVNPLVAAIFAITGINTDAGDAEKK